MIRNTIAFIAILISSICFAQEEVDNLDVGIIDAIIANRNTCVVGNSEDKIYLDPNRIFPSEQGLYLQLNNNNEFILLPNLNSDGNGCFVLAADRHPEIFNTCPGCGRKYFVSCNWPDCPLVKQKQEREREKERKKEEHREKKKDKR